MSVLLMVDVISYARPAPPREPPPSPVTAMVLCVPGIICWCGLAGLFGEILLGWRWRLAVRIPTGFLLFCWAIAIVAAITSVTIYMRGPRPWYVWVNLAVNVSGLIFTIVVGCLILNGMMR